MPNACSGRYRLFKGENPLGPSRPTFKHISRDRYIFYLEHTGFTKNWVCGKEDGVILIESKY